ncbi:MAG: hypothetical protein KHY12_00905 [Firmicutes bacterium]|nr:hypothetical protein [Oscillospiraceae bacterium]MBS5432305.1 hypothetical protein [Bacillota bacterium]
MRLKLKAALLLCLVSAAAYTGSRAYMSLRPVRKDQLPKEIYARFAAREDSAQFYLRGSGDYVAVFETKRGRSPLSVTAIELGCLRGADRAMLEEGIPVSSQRELLQLLEDLGS